MVCQLEMFSHGRTEAELSCSVLKCVNLCIMAILFWSNGLGGERIRGKIGLIFIVMISFGGKVFDSYMAIMLGLKHKNFFRCEKLYIYIKYIFFGSNIYIYI